jgi:spore maturation protein CgeB
MFYHSILSDWNHGNAHFLRGIVRELDAMGHEVAVYEPKNAWSLHHLIADHGTAPLMALYERYPFIQAHRYRLAHLDFEQALEGADLVLVHEWNERELVRRIARCHRRRGDFVLLFHDTHHRLVSRPDEMQQYKLDSFDGVLAFGESLRQLYLERALAERVWVWHEAADTALFRPQTPERMVNPLVWIGNWGDGERTQELQRFLYEPLRELNLRATIYGVRYPEEALRSLRAQGLQYAGWIPNFLVPQIFSQHRVTVHIPREYYVTHLPGVPTIRVFEALACGIPLICAPWEDTEGLFRPGKDFLIAENQQQMTDLLKAVLGQKDLASSLAKSGLETILQRHTCRHRAEELIGIYRQIVSGNQRRFHDASPALSERKNERELCR